MIIVNIAFTAVEIAKFARNQPLSLRIHFNDGKDRVLEKQTDFANVEEFTQQIINEARKLSKEANAKNTGGFLDDVVQVRFGNDEEESEKRLYQLLARIKEDFRRMRSPDAQNYLQKIAMFQGSRYKL